MGIFSQVDTLHWSYYNMFRKAAEVGRRYGQLTVLGQGVNKKGKAHWLFKCDCGVEKHMYSYWVEKGSYVSCGCHRKKHATKHGMHKLPIYKVWIGVRQRCLNKKNDAYRYYGCRGIQVEWNDFKDFYEDMGASYKPGLTLERIDSNGNYCKENCRWATRAEQMLNTSRNRFITYNGQRKTIKEWADDLGFTYRMLSHRINRGWPIEKALTKRPQMRGLN